MHFDIYPRIKPVMPNQLKECRYWNDIGIFESIENVFSTTPCNLRYPNFDDICSSPLSPKLLPAAEILASEHTTGDFF